MRRLIKISAEYIARKNQYTKEQEEQVEYAMRVTFFEALKLIGEISVFSLLGYSTEVVAAAITMSIVKPFIGGYHEHTQVKCFIVTLIMFFAIIYLSTNLRLDFISNLILGAVSLYVIWQQAPVINPRMQLTRLELIKRNRIIGVTAVAVFLLISIALYRYSIISNVILWTIVFQALFMFNKRKLLEVS